MAEAPASLLERYEAFTAEKAARVRPATLQTYEAVRGHLEAFLPGSTAPPEAVVGPGFLDDFVSHLLTLGMANSTANKLLTRLRGFLVWMSDRGEIGTVPKAKRLPESASDVLYLKPDELATLGALDLSDEPAAAAARDLLLVCCSTGQRFGDAVSMRWEHVRSGDPAMWNLHVSKTNVTRRVPLLGPAARIIEARRAAGEATPVPLVTNQHANRALKEIGKRAGLTRPVTVVKTTGGERIRETRPLHECLTTHIGRKTFVTLAMQSGMDAHELLGFTHDDLRTLRRYAGQDEDRRATQMRRAVGNL